MSGGRGMVGRRVARDTARAAVYVAVELLLGLAWFAVLALGAVGAMLFLLWVGIPIVLAALAAARGVAGAERAAARLQGLSVPPPPPVRRLSGTGRQVLGLLGAPSTRRALGYGAARVALSVPALALLAVGVTAAAILVSLPFSDRLVQNNGWVSQAGWASWWGPPLALCVLALLLLGCRGLATVFGRLAGLLAPAQSELLRRRLEATEAESRLAAELHDGIGHSVTVMVLQAGAARRVLATDPTFAEQALVSIEAQGRRALDGLDAALTALGASVSGHDPLDVDNPTAEGASRGDQLAALVDGVRAVGQSVKVVLAVDPADLTPTQWELAHAVTREGLTNALRHASGAPTVVEWTRARGDLVIEIGTGPGGRAGVGPGGGRGLPALRQRFQAAGGSLENTGRADGGYRVRATLGVGTVETRQP